MAAASNANEDFRMIPIPYLLSASAVGTIYCAVFNLRNLKRLHKIRSFAQLPAALR